MIALTHFSASLGGLPVLRDVSFSAAPGTFVALCGPNGAGKTTLLRALAGLLPGTVPRPRDIAYLEQGARCAWDLTVREVAALGRLPHGDRGEAAVADALAACGIAGLAERRISALSGGQARRAMIARALAQAPRVLLLDEPVADLDPAAAHRIMALFRGVARGGGTVIVVLHALDLALAYADRMVVLESGRIVADDTPARAFPHAAAAFGMDMTASAALRLEPRA